MEITDEMAAIAIRAFYESSGPMGVDAMRAALAAVAPLIAARERKALMARLEGVARTFDHMATQKCWPAGARRSQKETAAALRGIAEAFSARGTP